MPFWRKENGKEKVNYKARLEHKQYLAQESPEPVYDLSDCGLKNVPSGVYSRIKVMRKKALLLQENELSSLNGGGSFIDLKELEVLDVHSNSLEKITEDFGLMSNLRVLNLENNKIKQLPTSLGNLTNLETLNLSGNNLKSLPESISGLKNLKSLDLRENCKLKVLPKEIAHLRLLETLHLGEGTLTYPAPDVVKEGTEAIKIFLCSACSIEYLSPAAYQASLTSSPGLNGLENGHSNGHHSSNGLPGDPYEDILKGHLEKVERIKEEKRQQALELERQMMEAQDRELEMKRVSAENRKKLLDKMEEEESKKEAEMIKLQQMKEDERKKLNERMLEAEAKSDSVIEELMYKNSSYSDPDKVKAALEEDRQAMEKQLTIIQEDVEKLKEKEVMRAMQMLMEEELQRKAAKKQYEERQDVVKHAMSSTLENDKAVEEVLAAKGKQQSDLIKTMLEDEKYQREAFQALLLQQDHRANEISDHMAQIQNELASLTMVELKKRDMKVEFELEVMSEKREQLTRLLLDLMHKQKQRADDLQKMMKEMEEGKKQEQENYWLIQYQKLMDTKPKGLEDAEKSLDKEVKSILIDSGAEELIPLFSAKNISLKQILFMDDADLEQIGVGSEYSRKTILNSILKFKDDEDRVASKQIPKSDGNASAPPVAEDEDVPSAPPTNGDTGDDDPSAPPIETFQSTECVICLEKKCDIIFLPCGHLCCCSNCEPAMTSCPLCRAPISQKVKI